MELDAIREKIASKFRESLKSNVMPTDLNFILDLNRLKVRCFRSGTFYKPEEIRIHSHNGQLFFINEKNLSSIEKEDMSSCLGKIINVFRQG